MVSGGEWCLCFHCWKRSRFTWTADGLLVCPGCGELEGHARFITGKVLRMADYEREEKSLNHPNNKRDWRAVTAALLGLFMLLAAPAWPAHDVTTDALTGDYSLAVWPNENLKKSFVATDTTVGLSSFRAAFDFNMADAALVANKQQHIWQIQRGDKNSWLVRVTVQYKSKFDRYRIRAIARNVGSTTRTGWVTLPDKGLTYAVEVAWAADGVLSVAVDGVKKEKAPTVEWIALTTGMMRLGAPLNTKFFTGTFRFDEVNVWHE